MGHAKAKGRSDAIRSPKTENPHRISHNTRVLVPRLCTFAPFVTDTVVGVLIILSRTVRLACQGMVGHLVLY